MWPTSNHTRDEWFKDNWRPGSLTKLVALANPVDRRHLHLRRHSNQSSGWRKSISEKQLI